MAGADEADRWLGTARGLLDQPTAPAHEALPLAYVRSFVEERPHLRVTEDPAGNLLVLAAGVPTGVPPVVFVAHLDHPAFVVDAAGAGVARLTFRGGVRAAHVRPGEEVRFFADGEAAPVGAGRLTEVGESGGRLTGGAAEVTSGEAVAGGFATWAFPGFVLQDGVITTRCCDDLLGAAAVLCALDGAGRNEEAPAVAGLFTRAEEVGFLGAMEAIRHRSVPRSAAVVSVECSKALADAPQGAGPIVRVGDARSTFDPGLTEALRQVAEGLRAADPAFAYQRKLMDGGTCEATAFAAAGYRASGLALPLGGYHNMAEGPGGEPSIGPETVRVDDFCALVRLLGELARHPCALARPSRRRPAWFAQLARTARAELSRR